MSKADPFSTIDLVVFDVDGIFTDGHTWQDASGQWRRTLSVRDAMGIRALKRAGFRVAVVTQVQAAEVREYMATLHLDAFIENCPDKSRSIAEVLQKHDLQFSRAALVTKDERDLPHFAKFGCTVTVPSASPSLRLAAAVVTHADGGDGAVLEVCNRLLHTQKMTLEAGAPVSRMARRRAG